MTAMLPQLEAFSGEEHRAFTLMGGKPAALFVHGFPGTANDLRGLAEALNADGWTTHNVLLPGFGRDIERLPKHTYRDWLAAVADRLTDLKRRHAPVMLVGHSMGGALSITAAAQVGVDALVLLAPFYKINSPLWSVLPVVQAVLPSVKPFKLFKPDFSNAEFRDGVSKFVPNFDFDDPQQRAALSELSVPVRVFAQVREAGVRAYANAPKIGVPTLVVQGRRDSLVMPDNTRALMARLRGATQWVEVDGEHEINRPDHASWPEVRQAVARFADVVAGGKR
jgi:carboxylesterase